MCRFVRRRAAALRCSDTAVLLDALKSAGGPGVEIGESLWEGSRRWGWCRGFTSSFYLSKEGAANEGAIFDCAKRGQCE